MTSSAPARTLGRYEILHELKSGGMGEVLLARRMGAAGFEKLVAVKTIRGELRGNAALRTMFFDEAQLLARLDHPAIAHVHDFGEDGDALYLAMEYVPGIHFRELATRRAPAGVLALAMAEALRGLHAAHELADLSGMPLGVVHRDVTPENLMLTFDGRVKVLDFGIALVRGRRAPVTEYGSVKGKPPYLSPEQVKNQALDRRSDIFSAALVLHELLTGEPVFRGDSVYQIAWSIEHEPLAPPSAKRSGLPDKLDAIVMCGLERDKERRFATAAAMAEALESVARDERADSLPRFVEAALRADRDRNRTWLREMLAERDSVLTGLNAAGGRPTGRMTAPMKSPAGPAALAAAAASASMDVVRPPPISDRVTLATPPQPRAEAPPPRRRSALRWALVFIAIMFVVGGALSFLALEKRPSDDAADAAVIALVADAAVSPPVDAAVAEVPVDAAPAPRPVDAGARTRPDAGSSSRRRDAAVAAIIPDAAVAAVIPDAAPAPVGDGFLTVGSEPYSNIEVDGKFVKATPLFKHRLPVGEHSVVCLDPVDKTSRKRVKVDIQLGKESSVFCF